MTGDYSGSRFTPAQWQRIRELTEGKPATRVRVAEAVGMNVSTLYARAAAEGWWAVDYRRQDVVATHYRAAQLSRFHAGGGEDVPDAQDAANECIEEKAAELAARDASAAGDEDDDGGAAEDEIEDDPAELMGRTSRFVARQLARIMANAERRGGRLDKTQIDGLTALSRIMERWEVMAREHNDTEGEKSDDELADILDEIDGQIARLAEAEAARLFEERIRQDAG